MIKRTRRSGSVAVELLLLSPIVIGLILAVIEISMMTAANEHLAAASREGCRVAALGGNVNEVQRAVYNHLGYGSLAQAQITIIFLQDGQGNPLPVVATLDENGNPTSSVQGNSSGQVSGSGQGNNSGQSHPSWRTGAGASGHPGRPPPCPIFWPSSASVSKTRPWSGKRSCARNEAAGARDWRCIEFPVRVSRIVRDVRANP